MGKAFLFCLQTLLSSLVKQPRSLLQQAPKKTLGIFFFQLAEKLCGYFQGTKYKVSCQPPHPSTALHRNPLKLLGQRPQRTTRFLLQSPAPALGRDSPNFTLLLPASPCFSQDSDTQGPRAYLHQIFQQHNSSKEQQQLFKTHVCQSSPHGLQHGSCQKPLHRLSGEMLTCNTTITSSTSHQLQLINP